MARSILVHCIRYLWGRRVCFACSGKCLSDFWKSYQKHQSLFLIARTVWLYAVASINIPYYLTVKSLFTHLQGQCIKIVCATGQFLQQKAYNFCSLKFIWTLIFSYVRRRWSVFWGVKFSCILNILQTHLIDTIIIYTYLSVYIYKLDITPLVLIDASNKFLHSSLCACSVVLYNCWFDNLWLIEVHGFIIWFKHLRFLEVDILFAISHLW